MSLRIDYDADPERLRTLIREVLLQFERFGVDDAAPAFISGSAEVVAVVARSRARLVDVLRSDQRLNSLDNLGPGELQSILLELVRLCVEGRLQTHLSEASVPYPIYNFFAGFDDNADGPWDRVPVENETPTTIAWEVMGIPTRFPIGVPASGLTANAQWVRYFARRGFNILTFKSVRSLKWPAHLWPHWVFIEDHEPWHSLEDVTPVQGDLNVWPKDLARFSTANSFGVPSLDPDDWQLEVEQSLAGLEPGQLLIVSVMGTSDRYRGSAMVKDFVTVSQRAERAGAPAIELNLSCPNTVRTDAPEGMEPLICLDPVTTREIVQAVRAGLSGDTKLVAKLGYMPRQLLEEVVTGIGAEVDAISGINTVQTEIQSPSTGKTPFIGTADDPERERTEAGVSGTLIRELGLDFVRQVAALSQSFEFDVIGMGGVMTVDDVDAYISAGAAAVQSATGACLYPDLPNHIARKSAFATPKKQQSVLQRVTAAVASGGYSLLSSGTPKPDDQ